MENLPLEGGETVADPSVTPEVHRGRQVCSHHVRRAICPLGQRQVFHHQGHLKEPSLSGEVSQGPPSMIPHNWWQNFAVVVGRRTWSMCSGSITNTMLPPLRRRNGQGSRRSFLNTSSRIRRKHWASKKDAQWIIWHTSKTIFYKAMGLHLNGLRSFTALIKQGSYYHRLVARQGRLHECPHLAGVPLPRWPQVNPSESHRESQMKADAQTASSSRLVWELWWLLSLRLLLQRLLSQRLLLQRLLSMRLLLLKLLLPPLTHLLPWRQVERAMASHGPNASRLAPRRGFRGLGPQSYPGPNPGGASQDPHFPFPSKTVRGGSLPFCSSTIMWQSSLSPTTMWLVEG